MERQSGLAPRQLASIPLRSATARRPSDQGAVAVGQGATAGAVNATAVGQGATANNTGSTAIGAGATTNADNQLMFGTAGNTYQAPGITSSDSKASQTDGPIEVVTSDQSGHLATDGGFIFKQLKDINNHLKDTDFGVAMALAMSGAFLPDHSQVALAANYGNFDGVSAFAASGVIRIVGDTVLTGGVGVGFGDLQKVGGRVGIQTAW